MTNISTSRGSFSFNIRRIRTISERIALGQAGSVIRGLNTFV